MLNVTIQDRADHIYVRSTGTYEMSQAVGQFRELLASCSGRQVSRVLLDQRELQTLPTFTETYMYADAIAAQYRFFQRLGCPPLKLAYVMGPGNEALSDYGRDVGKSFGFDVLVTADMDEAFTWLGVEPNGR